MPPKIRISKEEIGRQAFELVRRQGIDALTAKSLARALNCSTQPIFWWFGTMQEVTDCVIRQAKNLFAEYVRRSDADPHAFKAIGLNYIAFAKDEKELFKLLFMRRRADAADAPDIVNSEENSPFILEAVRAESGLSEDDAKRVFRELWLFSHGIATMIATATADFGDRAIRQMLSDVYRGVLLHIESTGDRSDRR